MTKPDIATPFAVGSPVDRGVRPSEKARLSARQKRMKKAIAYMAGYMSSYGGQLGALNYTDQTFMDDVLYGLGVALHGSSVSYADGFDKWRQMLREHLGPGPNG